MTHNELSTRYRNTLNKLFVGQELDLERWGATIYEFANTYSKMPRLETREIDSAIIGDISDHEELYP